MGERYTTQTAVGYNATPPADDGSQVASNEITWAKHKTKLGDPLKVLSDAINTALLAVLDESSLDIGSSTTATAPQHKRLLNITGAFTLTLPDAATVGVGYRVFIKNSHSAAITIDLATGADTIDGSAGASLLLEPNALVTFVVIASADGYLSNNGHNWAVTNVAETFDENVSFTKAMILNSDYEETDNVTASTGAITLDLETGTFFHTPALTGIPTFTFSNPGASGRVSTFTLELNNGLNFAPVFPASVQWSAGIEPIWTAGTDIVTFVTRDGGTIWYGMLGGLNFS